MKSQTDCSETPRPSLRVPSLRTTAPSSVSLLITLALSSAAQEFTVLHDFTGGDDGANPRAPLLVSGATLYGTAVSGGSAGNGTVFTLNTDGTDFSTLHGFTAGSGSFITINSDGIAPVGGLILTSNTLCGAACDGGAGGAGTVFMVNTDGSDFVVLHAFTYGLTSTDGAFPNAALLPIGNTLYGTTDGGGANQNGTVFKVNTDQSGYATVFGFSFASGHVWPYSSLVASRGTLYGTSGGGGLRETNGTVFKVNMDGSGFAVLHVFTGDTNGATPSGGLILSGDTLYGTATSRAGMGAGTVFKVNINSSGFSVLHQFTGGSDGVGPQGPLVVSGHTLYGTTYAGGISGSGTVFKVNTDGSGFAVLYNFTGGDDGATPLAGLLLSSNTLYGTTYGGGGAGFGTVFALTLPLPLPPIPLQAQILSLPLLGQFLVLSWTNASFSLQGAPTAAGAYTNIPGAVSPFSVNTSERQGFFRLQAN